MKNKNAVLGLAAAMFYASSSVADYNEATKFTTTTKPHKPSSKNKPSKRGWVRSQPSPHFGLRSTPVTAITPKGPKRMKLKNALKHNYQFV